jgi:hypothetical protein
MRVTMTIRDDELGEPASDRFGTVPAEYRFGFAVPPEYSIVGRNYDDCVERSIEHGLQPCMETRGSDIHESIIALTGDNFQRSPDPKRRLGVV